MKSLALLLVGIALGALGMWWYLGPGGNPIQTGTTLYVQKQRDTVIINARKDTVIINARPTRLIIESFMEEYCKRVPRPAGCPEPDADTVPLP